MNRPTPLAGCPDEADLVAYNEAATAYVQHVNTQITALNGKAVPVPTASGDCDVVQLAEQLEAACLESEVVLSTVRHQTKPQKREDGSGRPATATARCRAHLSAKQAETASQLTGKSAEAFAATRKAAADKAAATEAKRPAAEAALRTED